MNLPYLLPCPFKYLTGYDCPGCGFQRSLSALLRGDFQHSLQLYPPTLPLLLTVLTGWIAWRFLRPVSALLIRSMTLTTGAIVLICYGMKMSGHPLF